MFDREKVSNRRLKVSTEKLKKTTTRQEENSVKKIKTKTKSDYNFGVLTTLKKSNKNPNAS